MDFKAFFDDEAAVSPVIGVILMVAITVILAAVIGTFVLGLGDQVQDTAPNAQFNWENPDDSTLEITHESGPSIDVERLEVVSSANSIDNYCDVPTDWTGGSKVSAGSSCDVVETGTATSVTGTYRLTWTSEGGGQSSTLAEYEA